MRLLVSGSLTHLLHSSGIFTVFLRLFLGINVLMCHATSLRSLRRSTPVDFKRHHYQSGY